MSVETDAPVAVNSDDHNFPGGTANDDTRYPRFCIRAETLLKLKRIRYLDIGCAGGGLIFDFLRRGHFAIGIEGSDYSYLNQRAQWGIIPNHLFTCDATRPFFIRSRSGDGARQKFDLISAWEVLEHLKEKEMSAFFENVKSHLDDKGLFVASVAMFECFDGNTGAVYHNTVKPKGWWLRKLDEAGFEPVDVGFKTPDFPRGSGNPAGTEWDEDKNPELGFHIVAAKKGSWK